MASMPRRLELLTYVALAFAGVLPALLTPGAIVGDGVDAFGSHWFYWWIRTCVENFGDPSFTGFFFFPAGKDIFAHTGNNFVDALWSVPFQWVFGPTLYQPLFVVLVLVGNALAFRPLARYVLGDGIAAFSATVLWQVNPFFHFELTAGRPTQAFAWYVPLAVLFFLRCARERDWRDGVKLGVAMGIVGWTYWFNTFFLALLFAALAAFELRDTPDRVGALKRWALGASVALVLASPAVIKMVLLRGAGGVPGLDTAKGSIFEPPIQLANNVSSELHGLALMELYGAPLFLQPAWGLPLLAAAFVALPLARGRLRWFVGMFVVIAFAFGPAITLDAERRWVMPHYMALYHYLPFFNRLWFPYRAVVAAFLPAALIVGALVARTRWPRAALAGLVVLGLGGQFVTGSFPFNHRVARSPRMLVDLKEEGGGVVFLPVKIQHDGLMWQTEFELPTFGGMGESAPLFWPPDFRARLNNGFMKVLRGAAMSPPMRPPVRDKDRQALRNMGFRWVVLRVSLFRAEVERLAALQKREPDLDKATADTIDALTAAIGSPPAGLDGDALLWDMDGKWRASDAYAVTPERLAASADSASHSPTYETKLRTLGRTGTPQDRHARAPR